MSSSSGDRSSYWDTAQHRGGRGTLHRQLIVCIREVERGLILRHRVLPQHQRLSLLAVQIGQHFDAQLLEPIHIHRVACGPVFGVAVRRLPVPHHVNQFLFGERAQRIADASTTHAGGALGNLDEGEVVAPTLLVDGEQDGQAAEHEVFCGLARAAQIDNDRNAGGIALDIRVLQDVVVERVGEYDFGAGRGQWNHRVLINNQWAWRRRGFCATLRCVYPNDTSRGFRVQGVATFARPPIPEPLA